MGAVAARPDRRSVGCSSTGSGWRWVFFVNLPVCVVGRGRRRGGCSSSRGRPTPARSPTWSDRPCWPLGVGAVSLALVQSDVWGWVDGRTIGAIAAGLVLGVAVRRPLAAVRPAPALDLSLFRIPSFRWGNVATAAFGLSFTAMFLANVTFLDDGVAAGASSRPGWRCRPGPLVVLAARPPVRAARRPHRARAR